MRKTTSFTNCKHLHKREFMHKQYTKMKQIDMIQKAMAVVFCLALTVCAEAKVRVGDLIYDLDSSSGTASVLFNKAEGDLVIPASIVYDGITYQVTSLIANAFSGCTALRSVTLPSTIKTVSVHAFSSCTALTSVSGDGVTKLDSYAFYNCLSLMDVKLPNLTTLGLYSLANCTSLRSINFPRAKDIYSYAFMGCRSLKTANLPETVTVINPYTFYGCSSLVAINSRASNIIFSAYSCLDCSKLQALNLSATKYTLMPYSLMGTSLKSINSNDPSPLIYDYALNDGVYLNTDNGSRKYQRMPGSHSSSSTHIDINSSNGSVIIQQSDSPTDDKNIPTI
jgi:hypothetical protein